LLNNKIFSYSKTPFLVRSVALFTEIMLSDSTRQILLFRQYMRKLTRDMAGKLIKAMDYKNKEFEKTRDYLKLNFKYPEYSIGFR